MTSCVPNVDANSPLPKSRGEATAIGASRYFTGEPCHAGHVDVRNTKSGKCMECSRIHTRNRQANDPKYREMQARLGREKQERLMADPVKREAKNARSRERHKELTQDEKAMEARRARHREYWANNPSIRERKKVTAEIWKAKPEAVAKRKARDKIIYHTKLKTDPAYKELQRAYGREYAKRNADKLQARCAKRRAMRARAVPTWLDEARQLEIELMYAVARRVSQETGVPHEIDHIVPLSNELVCGLHTPDNLQLLTQYANRAKGNQFLEVLT